MTSSWPCRRSATKSGRRGGERACRLPEDLRYHVQVHDRGRSPGEDHQLVHEGADRPAGRDRRDRSPGVRFVPEPVSAELPSVCTPKLLRIDGRPVCSGSPGRSVRRETTGPHRVRVRPDAKGMVLGPGNHTLDAAWERQPAGPGPARARLGSRRGGSPSLGDGSAQPLRGLSPPPRCRPLRREGPRRRFDGDLGETRGPRCHAAVLARPRREPECRLEGHRARRAFTRASEADRRYANGWYVTGSGAAHSS